MTQGVTPLNKRFSFSCFSNIGVPRKFLERHEREHAYPPGDTPGSTNQKLIERTNPEKFVDLFLEQRISLEKSLEKAHSCNSELTPETALNLLSDINNFPLLTQHLLLSILLRTNKATRHVKSFHTHRCSIDANQRGNLLKRAVWWHKLSKGERLPGEAALWEMGHISRKAFKGMRKMGKLVRKLVRKGEKVKRYSGKCAYWLKKMGVEEKRTMKMVFDPMTGEWRRHKPRVPAPTPQESEIKDRKRDNDKKTVEEQSEDDHPPSDDGVPGPSNWHITLPLRGKRPDSTDQQPTYVSDPRWVTEGEYEESKQVGPAEFSYTPLDLIPEVGEEEEAAAELLYLISRAVKTSTTLEKVIVEGQGEEDGNVVDEKSASSATTDATTRKLGREDETKEPEASGSHPPPEKKASSEDESTSHDPQTSDTRVSSEPEDCISDSTQESAPSSTTTNTPLRRDGIYVHRSVTVRRYRRIKGFKATVTSTASASRPKHHQHHPLRRKTACDSLQRLIHACNHPVGSGYDPPPAAAAAAAAATRNITSITATRDRRSVFVRTRRRPRLFRRRSAEKTVFAPTEAHVERLERSVRRLLKRGASLMRMYKVVMRHMDAWEPFVQSGQAWSGGRRRRLPGYAEGTTCMGDESEGESLEE